VSRVAVEQVRERKVHLADDASVFDDTKQEVAEENENRNEESSESQDLWKTEPLEYVDVSFRTEKNGEVYVSRALKDSAAEITLINTRMLQEKGVKPESQGKVKIRGVVGKPVEAQLSWLYLDYPGNSENMPVLCAVAEGFNEDFIIPSTVMMRLTDLAHEHDKIVPDTESGCEPNVDGTGLIINSEAESDSSSDVESEYLAAAVQTRAMAKQAGMLAGDKNTSQSDDDNHSDIQTNVSLNVDSDRKQATAEQLRSEQQSDETLAEWRRLADIGRG